MIPPLIRRCPECGHVSLATRFTVVSDDGPQRVQCPVCHHQFAPLEKPYLN